MTHEPKFVNAINRVNEQIEREDFSAAFRTFKITGFLPSKAIVKFVKRAPPTLALALVHAFREYCMTGISRENLFDRSVNLSVLLTLCKVQSIIGYYREKKCVHELIDRYGIPVPALIAHTCREIEREIKKSCSHEKLLASGFSRVHYDLQFSKYTHTELNFVLAIQTPRAEVKKLEEALRQSAGEDTCAFERPATHEGWLKLGFRIKHQANRAIFYYRLDEKGNEECYSVVYGSVQIATRHYRYGQFEVKSTHAE
jgi:hypothetical protein